VRKFFTEIATGLFNLWLLFVLVSAPLYAIYGWILISKHVRIVVQP
jgi:hypothetical protein